MRLLVPVAIALLAGIPLAMAVVYAGLDLSVWSSPAVHLSLRNGLLQAGLSTLASLAVGTGLAMVHRRRIPGGRWLLGLHAATFVLPVFVVVYAMTAMLGPRGWFPGILAGLGPLGAIVVAHTFYNHGFVALQVHSALAHRPVLQDEAARVLGADARARFWRVAVPYLVPTLLATALLVFLFSFTAFGTVLLLGQGTFPTLEMLMYGLQRGLFPAPAKATAIGLLQMGGTALLLALALRMRRVYERQGTQERPLAPASRTSTLLAYLGAGLVAIPVVVVLARGFQLDGAWSLTPWQSLLAGPLGFDLGRVMAHTGFYALLAVSIAVVVSLAASRTSEWWLSLPLAASPLFLALGLSLAYGPTGLGLPTPILVALAHAAVVVPFVARMVLPAASLIPESIPEAARLLGARPLAVAWRIRARSLRAPMATAALLGAALSLGELSLSLVLADAAAAPLSVWILRLDGPYHAIHEARSMALAGLMALLVLLLLAPRFRRLAT